MPKPRPLQPVDPKLLANVTGGAEPVYSNGNGELCRISKTTKRFVDCRRPPT
jgi:hypothetical protein